MSRTEAITHGFRKNRSGMKWFHGKLSWESFTFLGGMVSALPRIQGEAVKVPSYKLFHEPIDGSKLTL